MANPLFCGERSDNHRGGIDGFGAMLRTHCNAFAELDDSEVILVDGARGSMGK